MNVAGEVRGWDDERDGQFFRIISSCFARPFCDGASVLLASYDPDDQYRPVAVYAMAMTHL